MDGRREGWIRDAALSFSRAVDAARHSYFDVDAPACDASSVVDSLPHHRLLLDISEALYCTSYFYGGPVKNG